MSGIKKQNPHHFNLQQNAYTITNVSFASENAEKCQNQSLQHLDRKMRLLSLIIGSVYNKKVSHAFRIIKFKPLRSIYLRSRLVQVFCGLVRRSQHNYKHQAFKCIKKNHIQAINLSVIYQTSILTKSKISAGKVLNILFNKKQKENFEQGFRKISFYSKEKSLALNESLRKGFRRLICVKNKVLRKYFNQVRFSRYLIERKFKVHNLAKVLRQYRFRSLKMGLDRLRRNLYKEREISIRSQINLIDSRMMTQEDEQLRTLKQRQQQLQKNLSEVKRQKQQICQAYQIQVKQAETKSVQLKSQIQLLQSENEGFIDQIKKIDEKLKEQYSLDQIFQMFYNNLLLYLSKNKNKPILRSQMLEEIAKPLIPVEIPLDKLKEQNKVMKDLLSEYVLIFGQKTLEGKSLEIPYEYLVKENEIMYKMLVTLLPRLQYNKKQVSGLKESLQSVESVLKEFKK